VLREDDSDDPDSFARTLKPVVMEAIQDILDELETAHDNIAKSAKDHIHSEYASFLSLFFLDSIVVRHCRADFALQRNHLDDRQIKDGGDVSQICGALPQFHRHRCGKWSFVSVDRPSIQSPHMLKVAHAPSPLSYGGHDMARSLSSSGISTFLVPDSSVYALMSRVSKVILGAHAILTNGGMFAVTGSLLTATAARAHSTPVMVCAGQFKLTPLWNLYHEYGALDFADPSGVLGFEEGDLVDKVDVVNPYYDYVRPDLVDVYVTNEYVRLLLPPHALTDGITSGDHPPPSMYR
jgi:translation initiation factor eIF-2B subunit beta